MRNKGQKGTFAPSDSCSVVYYYHHYRSLISWRIYIHLFEVGWKQPLFPTFIITSVVKLHKCTWQQRLNPSICFPLPVPKCSLALTPGTEGHSSGKNSAGKKMDLRRKQRGLHGMALAWWNACVNKARSSVQLVLFPSNRVLLKGCDLFATNLSAGRNLVSVILEAPLKYLSLKRLRSWKAKTSNLNFQPPYCERRATKLFNI